MAKAKHQRKASKRIRSTMERWMNFSSKKRYAEQHSKAINKIYEQEDDSMNKMIESTKRLMSIQK